MFDSPSYLNRVGGTLKNYEYFLALINGTLTSTDVDTIMGEMRNSVDITDEDEVNLLSLLSSKSVTGTDQKAASETETDKQIKTYQSEFKAWYISNIVIISLIQWLLIFFLVVKISNK
jgi:hypothetical protein